MRNQVSSRMVERQRAAVAPRVEVLTGNSAAAYGVKLSRVEVAPIFPITPQTTLAEKLASLVASGEMKAKVMLPESEHSVMAACIGASATGARAFTATSSQGLALMHELLHYASGYRLPIVMVNCNRAVASPWNAWCDHSDSLAQRDTGWLQIYCENNQEALDTVIVSYRVAEQVLLPIMINLDGFILTHTAEPVEIPDQALVDSFLPRYQPKYKLDINDPYLIGAVVGSDWFTEMKFKAQRAMEESKEVIRKAEAEFRSMFGRSYGLVEEYRCDGADTVILAYATVASTARAVIDELRESGRKVGLVKLRVFRPFPVAEVRAAARKVRKIAVIDRNISVGHEGIFCQEVKSALYGASERPQVFGYVVGLGGRDITPKVIRGIVEATEQADSPDGEVIWGDAKL